MRNKDLFMQDSEKYLNENPEHFQSILNEEPKPDILNLIQRAEDGEMSLLDAVIQLRKIKESCDSTLSFIKEFEDKYKDQIETEASAYQNEYKGATFEFRAGGKMFSFKGISEIEQKEAELKALKDRYQSAWENKQKGLLAVTEDGEELQLPTVSYRKSSMIVKFK